MARNVFDDGQDAARQQPFAHRAAECRDGLGILAMGAIADDFVCAGNRHIEHRRAIDRDSDRAEIGGYQPGIDACRLAGRAHVAASREIGKDARRWPPGPVWRPETGDTAALLVDQYRRIVPADAVAKGRGQP